MSKLHPTRSLSPVREAAPLKKWAGSREQGQLKQIEERVKELSPPTVATLEKIRVLLTNPALTEEYLASLQPRLPVLLRTQRGAGAVIGFLMKKIEEVNRENAEHMRTALNAAGFLLQGTGEGKGNQ